MKRITGVIVALALLLPSTAFAAGSSSCQGYNVAAACNAATAQRGTGSGNGDGPAAASSLPFTGLDAVLLAAGGATLLGAGLVVRVLSRRLD